MSFLGSIPSESRKVLKSVVSDIKYPVLLIGAGNFTVASVLRSSGYTGPITACDVTLYTSALGACLTGKPLEISENPECPDHLKGLLDLSSPEATAASMALLYDLRQVWKQRNLYQKDIIEKYRRLWPDLKLKTIDRLLAYKAHIGEIDYQAKDGFTLLKESDPEHTVIMAPPIYKGDYEKLDKLLRTVAVWKPPSYRPILDKELDVYHLVSRYEAYFVLLYKDLPEVHQIIGKPSSVILPRGRNSNSLYVVTKGFEKKVVLRHRIESESVGAILPYEYRPTGKETVSMAKITLKQSLRMNELFASVRINTFTGGVSDSFAFFLDGKVFGKCDFCLSTHQWKFPDADSDSTMVYLMADLVVPSCTRKLAKLVLICLLSADVKRVMDLHFMGDFKYVATTAFSRHPSSMKYRGLFKMHKRMTDPEGFRLNYYAKFGNHSLKEALSTWKKKYDKQ